ncbi:MAG: hypothetical protein ACR2NP_19540 [Pirellulaceae bacterium]
MFPSKRLFNMWFYIGLLIVVLLCTLTLMWSAPRDSRSTRL